MLPTLPGPRQAVNASTAEYSYSQGGQEGVEIGPVLPKTNRENLVGRNAAFKVPIRHYHKLLTPNICLFRGMHARTFLTEACDGYKTH